MNIALGSICRNSTRYLDRYFSQVDTLSQVLKKEGHTLRLIVAESDSEDTTWDELQKRAGALPHLRASLVKFDQGGTFYGSVDLPARWAQLATVCNLVMNRVESTDDTLIYVESDLIWESGTMVALANHLARVPAVAPLCFMNNTERLYDTWGTRGMNKSHFVWHSPYHDSLRDYDVHVDDLVQIYSVGSCIVMRGEVAMHARFQKEDCIVGLCRDIQDKGYTIWLNPTLAVKHP